MTRHWLFGLNAAVAVFVSGALAAPVLAAVGSTQIADALYAAYHLTCHQWAFRTFFLFGPQSVYAPEQLQGLGLDPFAFVGSSTFGWKMAICERDVAIYASALLAGLVYARYRHTPGLSFKLYALLIAPMALDGFTQLFGWRESTWELRVLTGVLFGAASVWLLFPRFEVALAGREYAPESVCVAPPPRG